METSASSSNSQLCQGCKHNLCSDVEKFLGNYEYTREYLINHGIISTSMKCPKCNKICGYRQDKHSWRCDTKTKIPKSRKYRRCDFSVSDCKGTFLSNTRLPIWKFIFFIDSFLNGEWDCKTMTECHQINQITGISYR